MGNGVVIGFDPANRAGNRPIKIDGRDRASPPGLAGGPRAQGKVAEQAAVRFVFGPPEQCLVLLFFLFFQKQFQ